MLKSGGENRQRSCGDGIRYGDEEEISIVFQLLPPILLLSLIISDSVNEILLRFFMNEEAF